MTTKEEILAQAGEPVAYLRFWAAQYYAGHGDIETDEGFEVTTRMEPGADGAPAFPVFTADQVLAIRKDLEFERDVQKADIAFLNKQLAEKGAEIERLKEEQAELIRRFQNENCGQTFMGEPVIQDRPVPAKQYMAAVNGRRAFRSQVIELRQQLAAAQLQIRRYQDALQICLAEIAVWRDENNCDDFNSPAVNDALSQPQDTSALEAMIQKAGEVMRERAATLWLQCSEEEEWNLEEAIRALPGVTLEDLK